MYKKLTLILLVSFSILGCNGSNENSNSNKISGVYLDKDDNLFLIDYLDTKKVYIRTKNGIEFHTMNNMYESNGAYYSKGLYSWEDGVESKKENVITTFHIVDNNKVKIVSKSENKVLLSSTVNREPSYKMIDDLVGTHTDNKYGEVLTINADGSFTDIGFTDTLMKNCIIEGKLTSVENIYYKITAFASGCKDKSFDDEYHGNMYIVDNRAYINLVKNNVPVWSDISLN
ncbi:TPA: hypothetical protein ACN37P_004435 [Vibrio parahaemolyticus]